MRAEREGRLITQIRSHGTVDIRIIGTLEECGAMIALLDQQAHVTDVSGAISMDPIRVRVYLTVARRIRVGESPCEH